MFTGIIKAKGQVKNVSKARDLLCMSIVAPKTWSFKKGESVSVMGICSTVVNSKKNIFEVEYMKETLSKTTAGDWRSGKIVNLEKSLKVGDALGGHFVYGHIDTIGRIMKITNYELRIEIKIPREFLKYVVYKGSICVDGVSLTVSKKGMDFFEVAVIPYTTKHTTLGDLKKGDMVNVEVDIISKYIERMSTKS